MNQPTSIIDRTRGRLVRAAMSVALTFGLAGGASAQLFVSSAGNDSIKQYNQTTGAYEGDFVPQGSGGLQFPQGLTFGPGGDLFVSNPGSNSVQRYDGATGASLGAFVAPSSGGLTNPSYLTFGSDGNLYISSQGNDRINRYDGTTGAPLGTTGNPDDASFAVQIFNPPVPGSPDPRNTGITGPSGLAFNPTGTLFVSSTGTDSVKRIDATGANVDGENGDFVAVDDPLGLTFDAAGNLYVSSLGINGVQRFDVLGNLTATYTDPSLTGPDGVAIGPDGLLYVSSFDNSSVVRFLLDGTFVDAFVAPSSGDLFLPVGLTFRPQAAPVPEPSVLLLLGAGIAAGSIAARRKRARAA